MSRPNPQSACAMRQSTTIEVSTASYPTRIRGPLNLWGYTKEIGGRKRSQTPREDSHASRRAAEHRSMHTACIIGPESGPSGSSRRRRADSLRRRGTTDAKRQKATPRSAAGGIGRASWTRGRTVRAAHRTRDRAHPPHRARRAREHRHGRRLPSLTRDRGRQGLQARRARPAVLSARTRRRHDRARRKSRPLVRSRPEARPRPERDALPHLRRR